MGWIIASYDPRCQDERVAGGKGASLARLKAAGFEVPPFVVVGTAAYRQMSGRTLEPEFLEELASALAELEGAGAVAVRSSATGEDAPDSSFAGLYHTSLDVAGRDAVAEAICACWDSFGDTAATEYREQRTEEADGAMAVVIQAMVHGEWSGVAFSANPVSLALSEALINAVPGLGESLVSGEVNPEEITLSASDGRVLRRQAGAASQRLPEDVRQAVWSATRAIAERFEFPQDVEWTYRGGQLFILQSRPITTIADVFYSRMLETWKDDPAAKPDDPGRVWSRMVADETWVSPISPLFYNVHNSAPGRAAFIRNHGDQVVLPPDIFKYHKAIAYMDVRVIKRMYEFQPKVARIQAVLNFFPVGMQRSVKDAKFRWRGRLKRVLDYERHDRQVRSISHCSAYVDAQWPPFIEQSDRWLDMDLDQLPMEDLRAHQAEVGQAMAKVGPPCATAVLYHATDIHLLLTGLLDRWCRSMGSDGENLYARISAGLDNSETVREAEAVWEMAHAIRQLGREAVEHARPGHWAEFRDWAVESQPGRAIVESFEHFWRNHRHTGSTYKDLIWPRWGDDVDRCFSIVSAQLDSDAIRPSVVNRRSAESRRAAQVEILRSLRGPFAPVRRLILRRLFRYNDIYMAQRDNHRFYFDRCWYELRRIYRSFGKRLTDAGILNDRDEVFFLGVAEIEAGLAGQLERARAQRRIVVRRREWETTLHKQGAKFLKGWAPYEDRPGRREAEQAAGELTGIAASPGTVVGKARVVFDVKELSSVRDGEILVTRQTDPSWTTVFGRIGGLVLETGGVLSHGTSLCREYGLPCVTAVEQATARIPDGSTIELMGTEGRVRLSSN